MSWQKIKFGTDGWRAIIAEDFTFDNVSLVTAAIAKYIQETYPANKPVLVSYDPRFLADKFAQRACDVLASYGLKALLVDRDTPTPVIAYAAKHLNSAGALQFTASHNPAEYCGLKYIPDYAGPANESITNKIKKYVDELGKQGYEYKAIHEDKPSYKIFSPKEDYIKEIKTLINLEAIKKANLKIGLDTLNGAGRGYYEGLINCKVSLGGDRDPLFRGKLPEPIVATLQVLIEQIKLQGLDIGLSNDGDADRFAILDSEGELFTPNQIISILAKYLAENKGLKGAIVRTVATTHLLDLLAAKLNLEIIETPVGFKYIAEQMIEKKVLIGGEESGGLSILGHIPEKDGILACLLVCEMLAITKKSLKQLWKEVTDFTNFIPQNTRLDLHLSNERKISICEELKKSPPSECAGIKVEKVGYKDGTKLYLTDGSWLLVRPSGTEPLLRVYIEADSPSKLEKLKSYAAKELCGVSEKDLATAH
jgi:phosphomannomutase